MINLSMPGTAETLQTAVEYGTAYTSWEDEFEEVDDEN